MRPVLPDEVRRDKKVNCRANEDEVLFINRMKEKHKIGLREIIMLGIKTLENNSK